MKQKIFTLLFAIMADTCLLFASNTQVDGIWYSFNSSTKTASVTYRGSSYNSYDDEYSGSVNIPSSVKYEGVTYSVKSIGYEAFSACKTLTSVTIPNSVTSIGEGAFSGCGLTSVTIPNSVTKIEKDAFYGCVSLTSVTIPNSVTSIGSMAFYNVPNIVYNGSATGSPWMARSVNGFVDGWLVFKDNTKITLLACSAAASGEITIPNSVTSIGNKAFSGCKSLTSVTIPNSVTSIGNDAFSNCSDLTSVTIPNSVTSIGEYAFLNCISLVSVTIPNSVTKIEKDAFYGCTSLISVTIPNSATSIETGVFHDCRSLTSISIPNSVTSIGNEAFKGCSSLTSITCEAVTPPTLGNFVFNGVGKSIPLYVPAESIDAYQAAEQWKDFNIQAIPGTATSGKCGDNLTWNLTDSVLTIKGSGCMNHYSKSSPAPWFLHRFSIKSAILYNGCIGNYAFYGCSSLTSIIIKTEYSVSICDCAFADCSSLVSVNLGNKEVGVIGDYAFCNCISLQSIHMGNVSNIGDYAFKNCRSLSSITTTFVGYEVGSNPFEECISLPVIDNIRYAGEFLVEVVDKTQTYNSIKEGTRYILDGAFRGCNAMNYLTIPSSVRRIGYGVFSGCSNLKILYVKRSNPPMLHSNIFSGVPINMIFVPNEGINNYKNASYWQNMNIQVAVDSKETIMSPTSFSIEWIHNVWIAMNEYIASIGMEGGETFDGNILELASLEPNKEYTNLPIVLTSNTGETETVNVSFTTTALELTTQPSKPVSSNIAILLAETNMADIETSCGFEWKRNDAPEDMVPNKVVCPVANGIMAGRLKNLKDDVYYKYRAFYQSKAGNMYYGDWQYIFTGDVAVEFDPILYTYAAALIKECEATLKGYALAGSTDFTEQGFEYWAESRAPLSNAPRRQSAALGERHTVTASGISMKTTLSNLDPGTNYRYRTYAKIGDQILYGSEVTFTTQGEFTYAITFTNWNGEELLTLHVAENALPEYTGETPERPEDEEYTYEFSGWSPSVTAATSDVTYTAQFTAVPKSPSAIDQITNDSSAVVTKILRDGQIFIQRGEKLYTLQGQEAK